MYSKTLYAGWGDMDFNAHMRNTAYLDKSGDVRMIFFAENGFPMSEFMRLELGPVVTDDRLEYFKEVRLLEAVTVSLQLAGLSADGSRFLLVNEFRRSGGRLAARVSSAGGWLHLAGRRLCAPPLPLLAALEQLSRTADFRELEAVAAR